MPARVISLPEPSADSHTVTLVDREHGPRTVELVQAERFILRSFGGPDGKLESKHREYPDVARARWAAAEGLERLRLRGYIDAAREPKLEAAILAAPDDPANYLVYADYLSAQGHPRGELISIAAAIEEHGELPELRERERELLAANPYTLMDPRWRELRLRWRFGYVESLVTTIPLESFIERGATRRAPFDPTAGGYAWIAATIGDLLSQLRPHPSAMLLRRVETAKSRYSVRRVELAERPRWTRLRYGWELTRLD